MSGPDAPLLAVDGVVKRFGAFTANDRVSMSLWPGRIHALLGENGAGKSTLVKMIYGLLQPDEGVMRWRGVPTAISSPDAARRLGVAMVFQHFSLFENMSVLENIALGLPGRRADGALAEEAAALAARYRLAIDLRAPVWRLSAGERQRIEIIRALLQKPELLMLDEPTSVLTPGEADGLFDTLRQLADEGASVLFISHKLPEVRALCGSATILRGGKLVAEIDPRVETDRSLAALMVGADVDQARRGGRAEASGQVGLLVAGLWTTPEDPHGVSLRDVDLDVRAGEVLAIAGVAGAGQGELFAALSGERPPSGGRIVLDGADVTRMGIAERRARRAAFVPEERLGQATLPTASLADNLALSLPRAEASKTSGVLDRSGFDRRLGDVVERFDVRMSGKNPEARRLSGGNLQKYVIGREILRRPGLLVVNQPTWGVDAAATQAIRQALLDLARDGAAVLIISQDLDEVFALADRIAVLHGGRLSQATPVALATRESVGLLMTGGEGARDAA